MTERKDKLYRSEKCLNCETSLDISEKYCHQCGQLNSTKKLTLKDFFEEFLSNFYAYDSRLRNSIVSVFTKPGILAKEFNDGKRQKYANPFRLFLSVSIVLFIVASLSNEQEGILNNLNEKEIAQEIKDEKQADSIAKLLGYSANLEKEKNAKFVFHKDSIYTQKQIEKTQFQYSITSFRNFHLKYPEKSTETGLIELGYDNNFYNRFIFDKAKTFKSNEITAEIISFFAQKLPLFLFITLPILAIMFWLVFYIKSKNYTEHLVFTYTFYTFLFIILTLIYLTEFFSESLANKFQIFSFSLLFPIYLYKSLRAFYKNSRWKTVFKFVLLNLLFFPFAIICILFILFLGTLFF